MKQNRTFDAIQKDYWITNTNLRPYNHAVVELFANQRVNLIKKELGSWRPSEALDVGCGDGFGMFYMQNIVSRIYGSDISPEMLKANPSDKTMLICASAYNLPYEDSSFDLVYCWELLHHIDRPIEVVKEMVRVSKNGIIICEPNSLNPAMCLFGLINPIERGTIKFNPFYVKGLLADAGIKKIKQHTVGLFTPNRTPYFLANIFTKLPYNIPLLGLYTISFGFTGKNKRI
jgi:ubiquinone/menaquinone biosynthesis C-methylase UbiE